MGQMAACNLKGGPRSDEVTEIYRRLCSFLQLQRFNTFPHCFGFTARDFNVLVSI